MQTTLFMLPYWGLFPWIIARKSSLLFFVDSASPSVVVVVVVAFVTFPPLLPSAVRFTPRPPRFPPRPGC